MAEPLSACISAICGVFSAATTALMTSSSSYVCAPARLTAARAACVVSPCTIQRFFTATAAGATETSTAECLTVPTTARTAAPRIARRFIHDPCVALRTRRSTTVDATIGSRTRLCARCIRPRLSAWNRDTAHVIARQVFSAAARFLRTHEHSRPASRQAPRCRIFRRPTPAVRPSRRPRQDSESA